MAISARPISSEKKTVGAPACTEALRATSIASVDLPMAGRAAMMIICPPAKPLVIASSSLKPVGTPSMPPVALFALLISSRAASTARCSGT